MATAERDIANRALQAVGAKGRITALDEAEAATSREARLCLQHFATARDETLSDADWPFARHRVTLAMPSEDPADGWDYVYAYPDECLRVRKITDPNDADPNKPHPFETSLNVAGTSKIILTNISTAVAVYTRRVVDPNIWSPWFDTALGFRLAMMIAFPLVGKGAAALEKRVAQNYIHALARALGGVHGERKEEAEPDASWQQERV